MARRGLVPARHHELLIEKLQEVADGGCERLMVQMPPGSAKSIYGSVLFPAYFFSRHQTAQIIATAHTASLADYFGRKVRETIDEDAGRLGLTLARQSRGSARFYLESGGEYFAAGVQGPITGRRADLIVIDDPVKSWAEGENKGARDTLYDWYRAELSARLKPRGRIVLIMTRWHEDDLAGRLMARGHGWEQLCLPALAEAGDPLGRAPGEALWPEWQDAEAIGRLRAEIGERTFAALYQQRPRPPLAALFQVEKISILAEAPAVARCIRAWDLAATAAGGGGNPDYTVGLKLGQTTDDRLIVLDVLRFQAPPGEVEARLLAAARLDGTAAVLALPQDPGQAGKAQVAGLIRRLAGYQVLASPEQGSKIARATPAAIQVEAGNVFMVAAPWNDALLAELAAFPDAEKDDQVDALSRAVNTLATMFGQPARRLSVPLFER